MQRHGDSRDQQIAWMTNGKFADFFFLWNAADPSPTGRLDPPRKIRYWCNYVHGQSRTLCYMKHAMVDEDSVEGLDGVRKKGSEGQDSQSAVSALHSFSACTSACREWRCAGHVPTAAESEIIVEAIRSIFRNAVQLPRCDTRTQIAECHH
jgi:hypothetical protein